MIKNLLFLPLILISFGFLFTNCEDNTKGSNDVITVYTPDTIFLMDSNNKYVIDYISITATDWIKDTVDTTMLYYKAGIPSITKNVVDSGMVLVYSKNIQKATWQLLPVYNNNGTIVREDFLLWTDTIQVIQQFDSIVHKDDALYKIVLYYYGH
jgi:hypothetical protein